MLNRVDEVNDEAIGYNFLISLACEFRQLPPSVVMFDKNEIIGCDLSRTEQVDNGDPIDAEVRNFVLKLNQWYFRVGFAEKRNELPL